ncbi:hypothetical protein [Asticcacaulis sp.]|uniref:hypothetical protein n=1 Tax=Asticcacaulis sp. TaxID=1872648 RepID=UPI0031DCF656
MRLHSKVEPGVRPNPSLVAPPTVVASPVSIKTDAAAAVAAAPAPLASQPQPVPEPARDVPREASREAPLHWREQLQHPASGLTGMAAAAAVHTDALSLNAQAAPQTYVHAEEVVEDDEWLAEDGRIAVSTEEAEANERSLWQMIASTLQWIFISVIGLAALGGAAGAYQKAINLEMTEPGNADVFTTMSITLAVVGIVCVCVSVWLIFRRLGGLKD